MSFRMAVNLHSSDSLQRHREYRIPSSIRCVPLLETVYEGLLVARSVVCPGSGGSVYDGWQLLIGSVKAWIKSKSSADESWAMHPCDQEALLSKIQGTVIEALLQDA